MATLHIIKGYLRGQRLPVSLPAMVFGRSWECQVVIPQTSVSRQHARRCAILRDEHRSNWFDGQEEQEEGS